MTQKDTGNKARMSDRKKRRVVRDGHRKMIDGADLYMAFNLKEIIYFIQLFYTFLHHIKMH